MGRRRRYTPPFEVEIERLGPKGMGVGTAPDGARVEVKPAPPGARILFAPQHKKRNCWKGRRLELVRPPKDYQKPPCEAFGLCGGCVLQELTLSAQRAAKWAYALGEVAEQMGRSVEALSERLLVHPPRGAKDGFGYRNKVELSFGRKRLLPEDEFAAGLPLGGRFLGFHGAGRFDRVVDISRCWLISDGANALLQVLREVALADGQPMPWDNRTHEGFWRHAMLREGMATGEHLVGLFTAAARTPAEERAVEQVAEALLAAKLPDGRQLVGVVWFENDEVADVARGVVRRVWGRDWLEERLGETRYQLPIEAFFQTSTDGAELLYETIAEALEGDFGPDKTLYDLYCGIGSIGLYLAPRFGQIVGVEEVDAAVRHARKNATENEIEWARYMTAKMEDALMLFDEAEGPCIWIVDPPRAGLHPKVARALARVQGERLLYVACHPASLGRDAVILEQGGWRMESLWTVDLFPQTGHVELVARFSRSNFGPARQP